MMEPLLSFASPYNTHAILFFLLDIHLSFRNSLTCPSTPFISLTPLFRKVQLRRAMFIPSSDETMLARISLPQRTEPPFDWMHPSITIARARELVNFIECTPALYSGDPVGMALRSRPSVADQRGRIVARAVVCAPADSADICYELARFRTEESASCDLTSDHAEDHSGGHFSDQEQDDLILHPPLLQRTKGVGSSIDVDEGKVAILVESMGFSAEMARDALRNSCNDIEAAAEALFSLMS